MTPEELIQRADEECPFEGVKRHVWMAAVRMLVRNGAVLCSKVTSVRFSVTPEGAARIINRAVVRTRLLLDGGTPRGDDVALEDASRAGTLASKIYTMP